MLASPKGKVLCEAISEKFRRITVTPSCGCSRRPWMRKDKDRSLLPIRRRPDYVWIKLESRSPLLLELVYHHFFQADNHRSMGEQSDLTKVATLPNAVRHIMTVLRLLFCNASFVVSVIAFYEVYIIQILLINRMKTDLKRTNH